MRKPVIAALTMGILLTLAAVRVGDLWWWRAHTLSTASARATNLAVILTESFRGSLSAGDSALRQLALHSRRVGGPSAPEDEWAPSLASARAGLPNMGSISIVDDAGIIRHSTQRRIVGQSRRTEYAFRQLAASATDDLILSTPYLSIVEPRQFLIPFARRLTRNTGAFDGIAVGILVPAAMRDLSQTLDVGRRGVVWIFHPDGVVLFREPSMSTAPGESAAANPIFKAAKQSSGAGTIDGRPGPGQPALLSAFRSMTQPPLIVAVSLDRDEVLADWRRQAIGSAVFFAVLAATMVGTLVVLFRQMDENAAARRALSRAQQVESDRLRAANERLEKALSLEKEFLMTVSHELRTPLTAIRGWASMLMAGGVREEQKTVALQSIDRNARAQTRLVEDLLDMSRVVDGTLGLDVRDVHLPSLLRDAVETVTPAADAKRIRIETAIDDTIEPMTGDPDRLQQILWNLLSNAIKFTAEGGRVDVRLERSGPDAAIVVRDTGVGISEAFLPHVFGRFRQEDAGTKRRFGGLGLGLAIVKHLVDLHGGIVTADSDGENRGATFTVRLPMQRAARV